MPKIMARGHQTSTASEALNFLLSSDVHYLFFLLILSVEKCLEMIVSTLSINSVK